MTQQMISFVLGLEWKDWLTIGGFIFGIVTLIAYIEQRRSAKGTAALTKWAELNLDKTISEQEIKRLLAQKSEMEEQITKNIPSLARVAVIKEQAELHRQALAQHFSTWQKLTAELESSVPVPGLDPKIQNVILDQIIPRFQQEQEINKLRSRITVLSVSIAAASAVLPFGLGSMLAIMFAPALISAAIRLHALTEDSANSFKSLRPFVHLAYVVATLVMGGFGVVLLNVDNLTMVGIYIAWALCGLAILLAMSYPLIRKKLDRWLALLVDATT
ncbi:hypothetical protein ACIDE9_07065 [Methylophilus sp. 'Pure River']|uniref:hypothetical protein n=1 Tax=Methylophilus sp. 'Pure River' TaxID=3377117 RepID=UPI00398F6AAB